MRKMRINFVLRRFGFHRMVWLPLRVWQGVASTKFESEAAEGRLIWDRDPSLNNLGRSSKTLPKEKYGDMTVLPRRNRRRQLIKFRRRQRGDEVAPTDVRVPPMVGDARPVGAGAAQTSFWIKNAAVRDPVRPGPR